MKNTRRAKIKRHQQIYESNSNPEIQQRQQVQPQKLSQSRDYIGMKAAQNMLKKKKKKSKVTGSVGLMGVNNASDSDQDEDNQAEGNYFKDPIALLSNYNSEQYFEYIQQIRNKVQNEMPYTEVSNSLLDALASKNTNICIYGFGSKIDYIQYLVDNYLSDHYGWEVDGFLPGMKEKKIYDNFGKFLVQAKLCSKIQKITMADQLEQYRQILQKYAKKNDKEIIIVFHCIDSSSFLNYDAQKALSSLLSLPKIKLICSIDNLKISYIWSPQIKTSLNLHFFHINTYKPNNRQQFYRRNATDTRQQDDQALSHIFQSLNNNQKKILKLFAKQQLDNLQKQQPTYYTLQTLLEDCIDNIILNSDTQLRENLYELIDHKVIVVEDANQNGKRKGKVYKLQCNRGMLDKIYKEKVEDQ